MVADTTAAPNTRDDPERAFAKFLVEGPGYPFDVAYREPDGTPIIPPVDLDLLAEAWCDWDEARWDALGMFPESAREPRDERVADMRAAIGIEVGASPVIIEDVAA